MLAHHVVERFFHLPQAQLTCFAVRGCQAMRTLVAQCTNAPAVAEQHNTAGRAMHVPSKKTKLMVEHATTTSFLSSNATCWQICPSAFLTHRFLSSNGWCEACGESSRGHCEDCPHGFGSLQFLAVSSRGVEEAHELQEPVHHPLDREKDLLCRRPHRNTDPHWLARAKARSLSDEDLAKAMAAAKRRRRGF